MGREIPENGADEEEEEPGGGRKAGKAEAEGTQSATPWNARASPSSA